MSVHEVIGAYQWIYTTLTGDSALTTAAPGGVHRAMAPAGVSTPFVIMQHQEGSDVLTMNAYRVMNRGTFQIKAVGPAKNTMAIAAAAARLDDLLRLSSGSVVGGLILSCNRESTLTYDELVVGEQWTNIGGLYRIQLQQV